MPWGHRSQMALAALINRPERVWTLLTAWAAPGHLVPVASVIMLLSIGVLLERLLGTRRWLVTGLVSAAGGILYSSRVVIATARGRNGSVGPTRGAQGTTRPEGT